MFLLPRPWFGCAAQVSVVVKAKSDGSAWTDSEGNKNRTVAERKIRIRRVMP
jgi:hypothetical protein